MEEEKRRRIVAAVTVNAVLLIFIIFAVIIYQIVEISVLSSRRNDLAAQKEALDKELAEREDLLEKIELEGENYYYILALQQGYIPSKR